MIITPPTYPARPLDGGPLSPGMMGWPGIPLIGRWYANPKYNGWRALIHPASGAVFNRHGQRLSIEQEFQAALALLKELPFEWLDAEGLSRRHSVGKGTLILLDAIQPGTYCERMAALGQACARIGLPVHSDLGEPVAAGAVYLCPAYPAHQAGPLYAALKEWNTLLGCEFYEGIVLKKADAPYPIQLRDPERATHTWVKHRWHF